MHTSSASIGTPYTHPDTLVLNIFGALVDVILVSQPPKVMTRCRVPLRWPKAAMDAKRQQASSTQVLRDWHAGTAPHVHSSLTMRMAVQVRWTRAADSFFPEHQQCTHAPPHVGGGESIATSTGLSLLQARLCSCPM